MSALSNLPSIYIYLPAPWGPWFQLNDETSWPSSYGIYRVRLAETAGNCHHLQQLCGVDHQGIIYIGRSGFLEGKTKRTLGHRLLEFYYQGSHSGAWT